MLTRTKTTQTLATILSLALASAASAGTVQTGQTGLSGNIPGVPGNPLGSSAKAQPGLGSLSGAMRLDIQVSLPLSAVPAPAVSEVPQVPAGQISLRPAPVVSNRQNGPAAVAGSPVFVSPVAVGVKPIIAAPAVSEIPQVPLAEQAAKTEAQPAALGSLQQSVVSAQAPEAKSSPSMVKRVFGKLFDGASVKAAKADDNAEVAGKDSQNISYLGRAPKTLFSAALALWKAAGVPTEVELQVKQDNGSLSDVGAERDLVEDAQVQAEPVKVELPESLAGADKVGLQKWIVTGGVKYAALVKGGVFWVDHTGNAFLYRRATAETVRIPVAPGKLGPVVASEDGQYVYAVVDGRLQRWELKDHDIAAKSVKAEALDASKIQGLEALNAEDADSRGDGVQIVMAGKRLYWAKSKIVAQTEGSEQITKNGSLRSGLSAVGRSLYVEKVGGSTRVWLKPYFGNETKLEDIGSLPYDIKAIAPGPVRGTYFAAVSEGVVEWDTKTRRYRLFAVPGLGESSPVRMDVDREGRVLLAMDHSLIQAEFSPAQEFLGSKAAEVRLWAQDNPMYVKDGALHIGDFTFPLGKKAAKPQPWYKRLFTRKSAVPSELASLGISEKDWQALNLPTNKRLIYDTLKGFSMSQHMLYIGETGGGKTWIAEKIAQLTNNELWMVSMNEYTRNKDLIARETFGEEGKNKTGLTMSTVLRWMTEGGVLLLDEMHKPLEGIAVLNNILQNGEYRLPDGRVIKYDKTKSWVIGTMNPVKPPYKGEPPSGELSSRFGMTLEVKYLPADEEAALLRIFYGKVSPGIIEKLVAIANDLRKVYPEVLPLPIAPRTLMHIVEHAQKYPQDSIVDIFTKTYNPASIVEDSAISEAITKVLEAHDLAGTGVKPQPKPEPVPEPVDDDVPF